MDSNNNLKKYVYIILEYVVEYKILYYLCHTRYTFSTPPPQFEAHSGSPSSQYLPFSKVRKGSGIVHIIKLSSFPRNLGGNPMHIVYRQWLTS